MNQLVPAAEQLSPTLVAFAKLAPEAKGFFEGLSTVIAVAPTGFPALRKLFRDDFPPLLRALDPFLRNLNPLLTGLSLYKHEVTSFFANIAAAANGELPTENANGRKAHFLRAMAPLNPESLTTLDSRLTTNRNSAYSPPQWAKGLASGLPGFDTRQCSSGITATLDPETPKNESFIKERDQERRSQRSRRLLQPPEEVRLRRTGQLRHPARPGLHPAGPLRTDLRQRPRNRLPAHVRTDRSALAGRARRRAALRPPFSQPVIWCC